MDSTDEAVQATNDDAQQCKLSCVQLGYFQDDYVQHFVRRPQKKAPLMHRGYYARRAALLSLLTTFRRLCRVAGSRCQVLVLGAGYDTTYFQHKSEGVTFDAYVELDFLDVVARKALILGSRPALRAALESNTEGGLVIDKGGCGVRTGRYCLQAADLRDIQQVAAAIEASPLDLAEPTFILSECVLVYMKPEEGNALIEWLAQSFQTAALVVYEQIRPGSQFGQQMVRNLEARGAALYGLRETPTLEAHEARLQRLGWPRTGAADMNRVYARHIERGDRRRIEAIEMFDEYEEWHLIMGHYALAYGVQDAAGALGGFGFEDYGDDTSAAGSGMPECRAPLPLAD